MGVCTDLWACKLQEDFVMGAISGAFAAAATTPLDVIKTRMMCSAASKPSMGTAARNILSTGGPRAFFRYFPCLTLLYSCRIGWLSTCGSGEMLCTCLLECMCSPQPFWSASAGFCRNEGVCVHV